ncbi:hypothetical protein TNCV_14471 [Trichonephila clavipes]|nr:hypothetical protein TNCV_14471 [Trichonephila clavipes]
MSRPTYVSFKLDCVEASFKDNGGFRTLPDLKASITRHVAEIPREVLSATIENAIMRFQHVIDAIGAHSVIE